MHSTELIDAVGSMLGESVNIGHEGPGDKSDEDESDGMRVIDSEDDGKSHNTAVSHSGGHLFGSTVPSGFGRSFGKWI